MEKELYFYPCGRKLQGFSEEASDGTVMIEVRWSYLSRIVEHKDVIF